MWEWQPVIIFVHEMHRKMYDCTNFAQHSSQYPEFKVGNICDFAKKSFILFLKQNNESKKTNISNETGPDHVDANASPLGRTIRSLMVVPCL